MAGCESIKTTVRRRRLAFAGSIQRMGEHRLQERLRHGELKGGYQEEGGTSQKVIVAVFE